MKRSVVRPLVGAWDLVSYVERARLWRWTARPGGLTVRRQGVRAWPGLQAGTVGSTAGGVADRAVAQFEALDWGQVVAYESGARKTNQDSFVP